MHIHRSMSQSYLCRLRSGFCVMVGNKMETMNSHQQAQVQFITSRLFISLLHAVIMSAIFHTPLRKRHHSRKQISSLHFIFHRLTVV